MVGHGHFRQRIWRGHIEAGDVEFGEVAIGDDVVTSRVGDIFQSLQRLALVAENVQDGSLEDGVQVPVDSYPLDGLCDANIILQGFYELLQFVVGDVAGLFLLQRGRQVQ